MTRFAIIADDLSSATDCGAQVVHSGLSVVVPLGSYSLSTDSHRPDVISVDTDSRSLPAEQAYVRTRSAAEQLVAQECTHFYKSVDSTLRGNLGAEVEAVLDVVKADCAIVAPAFPKYGRTTVNGVQYLHGRPLHETEFGTDPTAPVKDADISRRLAEGSRRKAGRVKLEDVRAGARELQDTVQKLMAEGSELIVVDIAEQQDLERLCLSFARSDLRILWVGSTGMAEFVPLAWGVTSASADTKPKTTFDTRPALALVGSASETTRTQLAYAEENRGLHLIHLDSACLIQEGTTAQDELK